MKTEDVSTLLRRAIREGVLAPGEDLVQEEIAGRLGVSRVPLREALRGLAAVGVVQMTHGRGFRVTKLESQEIEELYNLRLRIEPFIAADVVANATAPQIEALRDLDQQMRASGDAAAWATINYEFHLSMYEAAGVGHTIRIVRQLLDLVEPYSRIYVHELHNEDRVEHEHGSMMDALDSRDAEDLTQMIRLHLEGARDGLIEAMHTGTEAIDPITRLAGLSGST